MVKYHICLGPKSVLGYVSRNFLKLIFNIYTYIYIYIKCENREICVTHVEFKCHPGNDSQSYKARSLNCHLYS